MVIVGKVHNYEERCEEFPLFEYGIYDMNEHVEMKAVAYPSSRVERKQLSTIYADHHIRLRYHDRRESGGVEECVIHLRFRPDNNELEVSDNLDFEDVHMSGCSVKARNNEAAFDIIYNCNQIYVMPVRAADFMSDRTDERGRRSYIGYRITVAPKDMRARGRSHVTVDPVVNITDEVLE